MFGFKRKDPICGMKETKGKGIEKGSRWFCSKDCLETFGQRKEKAEKHGGHGCCGH